MRRRLTTHVRTARRASPPPARSTRGGSRDRQRPYRPALDESAVSRFTIPIKTSGLSVEYLVDQVFVRVGRGVAYLPFAEISSPFDEGLRNKPTTTVVDRLKTGLASST